MNLREDYQDLIFKLSDMIEQDFFSANMALNEGKRIARQEWMDSFGKHFPFVYKQLSVEIGIDIIPNMQSLPQSVKDVFIQRNKPIHFVDQMAMVFNDNTIDSWSPSVTDIFATDWVILD
jgi:hypothetical protein